MKNQRPTRYRNALAVLISSYLLLFTAACQGGGVTAASTSSLTKLAPAHPASPALPSAKPSASSTNRPVLAFYYTWYSPSTWCSCRMSDLPVTRYNSGDDATIDRQLREASGAGITGFISSWFGPGNALDSNFAKLLARSAVLESTTHVRFTSSMLFESDAAALRGTDNMLRGLRYLKAHYSNDAHYFHWQGKPVLFIWNPLGNGRTLSQWASLRSQVDPNNTMIWSAEGVDTSVLSVFDGLHLFSAAYWGVLAGTSVTVDQGFRNRIDAYNRAHHTNKIWAAGVLPGYDDTRVPGRRGAYIVPRKHGASYKASWTGAIASQPEWITITTYNEWYEGAMIEPSIRDGNFYLALTKHYVQQWRQS